MLVLIVVAGYFGHQYFFRTNAKTRDQLKQAQRPTLHGTVTLAKADGSYCYPPTVIWMFPAESPIATLMLNQAKAVQVYAMADQYAKQRLKAWNEDIENKVVHKATMEKNEKETREAGEALKTAFADYANATAAFTTALLYNASSGLSVKSDTQGKFDFPNLDRGNFVLTADTKVLSQNITWCTKISIYAQDVTVTLDNDNGIIY
jgi:hypothetical protein